MKYNLNLDINIQTEAHLDQSYSKQGVADLLRKYLEGWGSVMTLEDEDRRFIVMVENVSINSIDNIDIKDNKSGKN